MLSSARSRSGRGTACHSAMWRRRHNWHEPPVLVDPASVDWSTTPDEFSYRLRQRPGPRNSLGLVKFMFPNEHSVYLHDTPMKHLFEAPRRAFSHGCVRVQDPVALADFLLAR